MSESAIPVAAPVKHFCGLLRCQLERLETRSGLVVGCGNGHEVAYLKRQTACGRVFGLDLEPAFSPLARAEAGLLVADATCLPFPADTFDFAVAIHSLEHVEHPRQAMLELQRVLRPGGWLYVGVPNRIRLLGYVGSFDATLWQKFWWNVVDYSQRARGRFRNELGAHAGFEGKELADLLGTFFADVRLLTEDYLRFKYRARLPGWMLNFLLSPRLLNYSAPSHYAMCKKK